MTTKSVTAFIDILYSTKVGSKDDLVGALHCWFLQRFNMGTPVVMVCEDPKEIKTVKKLLSKPFIHAVFNKWHIIIGHQDKSK